MPRIVIAEDHPLFSEALSMTLERMVPSVEICCVGTLAGLLTILKRRACVDLVLLDLSLPDCEGLEGLAQLRAAAPRTPCLVLSGHDPGRLQDGARTLGARGYLHKSAPPTAIAAAVNDVLGGKDHFPEAGLEDESSRSAPLSKLGNLTPAQLRVLLAMRDGSLNKQIAYRLGISEITVKSHVKQILRKLDVGNRTQAILILQQLDSEVNDAISDPKG